MKKIYKCIIFGFGYMGQIRFREISKINDLDVVGVYDVNKKLLKNHIPNNLIIDKYKKIFELNFDLAFICTPNNISPNIIVDCLKNNINVFCEKPPARSLSEMKMIKKYVKNNKIMFGFNHRFHPAVLKAKQIIDSKKIGEVITLRGVYGKSGGIDFNRSWRNSKKISGGGILLDQGIHIIDLFRYLCGNFNKVKCFTSNNFWKFDVEDNAFLILKNNKNQLAQLHSSSTLWRHTFRIDITLEKGYILIEGLLSKTGSYGQEKITFANRQFENISKAIGNPSESVIYYDKDSSWKLEIKKFLDFVKKNKKVSINNFDDAYEAMKIVEIAYKQ